MKINRPDTVNSSLGLPENVREVTREYFDPMLPYGQEWFTPKEVASILGRSDQYVRDCLRTGRMLGHQFNSAVASGRRCRGRYQVHREGLILFLFEAANYKPGDIDERLSSKMRKRSDEVKA